LCLDGSNHQYYEFEVNALNTVWELRLDKPYMHGGSEHSERVGMRGQGNLRNLESGILVDGAVNDPGAVSKGWGITARFPFADLIAQGHCKSPPRFGVLSARPPPLILSSQAKMASVKPHILLPHRHFSSIATTNRCLAPSGLKCALFFLRAGRQGDVWRINSSRVQWRWEWRVEEGKGSWRKIEPEKGEDNWVRTQS
jgi:hypothetical protein